MFLSRSPLAARRQPVRLTCVRHAASVDPEPGSNSSKNGEAYWLLTSPLRRPVWWGDDARRTRQLVRCWRQKSEWAAWRGEPTRLTVTMENICAEARDGVVVDADKYTMLAKNCQASTLFSSSSRATRLWCCEKWSFPTLINIPGAPSAVKCAHIPVAAPGRTRRHAGA